MRIGCLQFAPQVGDVQNNLSLAEDVLGKLEPQELENLDLLVLPEMAFSGKQYPLFVGGCFHSSSPVSADAYWGG